MISVDELLEELDFMLDRADNVPLGGGRAVVNTDKIKEIIDDIRLHLPDEIRQARAIASERADIIATARKEAEGITRRAEERARAMISNEEVVRRANIQASEIVSQAQTKAREIRKSATDYAENIMRTTEDTISKQLTELRQSRQSLHATVKNDGSSADDGEGARSKGGAKGSRKAARAMIDVDIDGGDN